MRSVKHNKLRILILSSCLIIITALSFYGFLSGKDKITQKQYSVKENNYPINENGETYGSDIYSSEVGREPDLIEARGIDGTLGYVRSIDLDGELPTTPEEAVVYQEKQNDVTERIIPLYKKDGKTIIGKFLIKNGGK